MINFAVVAFCKFKFDFWSTTKRNSSSRSKKQHFLQQIFFLFSFSSMQNTRKNQKTTFSCSPFVGHSTFDRFTKRNHSVFANKKVFFFTFLLSINLQIFSKTKYTKEKYEKSFWCTMLRNREMGFYFGFCVFGWSVRIFLRWRLLGISQYH